MKNLKKIVLVLVALAMVFSFCFAVSAESGLSAPNNGNNIQTSEGQTGDGNQTGGNNTQQPTWMRIVTMILPIAILIAFFYFGMYKPQKKQEKEKKAMMDSLQVGSDVMTIGGIMGRIVSVKDDSVIIESGSDKNKLQISKQAISTVNPPKAD